MADDILEAIFIGDSKYELLASTGIHPRITIWPGAYDFSAPTTNIPMGQLGANLDGKPSANLYVFDKANSAWRDTTQTVAGFSGAVEPVRELLQFNNTDIRAVLNTPLVFTGDFEIEAKVKSIGSGTDIGVIAGAEVNGLQRFYLAYQYNAITVAINAVYSTMVNATAFDGNWHTYRFTRIGSTVTFYLDGNSLGSDASTSATATWAAIGGYAAGTNVFNGEMEYIKFTDNSGAPVTVTYNVNSGSTTIEYADGEVSPSTQYVTYMNVAEGDWVTKRWNSTTETWDTF